MRGYDFAWALFLGACVGWCVTAAVHDVRAQRDFDSLPRIHHIHTVSR